MDSNEGNVHPGCSPEPIYNGVNKNFFFVLFRFTARVALSEKAKLKCRYLTSIHATRGTELPPAAHRAAISKRRGALRTAEGSTLNALQSCRCAGDGGDTAEQCRSISFGLSRGCPRHRPREVFLKSTGEKYCAERRVSMLSLIIAGHYPVFFRKAQNIVYREATMVDAGKKTNTPEAPRHTSFCSLRLTRQLQKELRPEKADGRETKTAPFRRKPKQ